MCAWSAGRIAFNGWAACVTGEDSDREWQRALTADPDLSASFDGLVGSQTATASAARRFAELWPIFKVAELRARQIDYWGGHDSRADMTRTYVGGGARLYEPRCFFEHEHTPLDWGHTLAALSRVRNNLFHGEKARSSESDGRVVGAAYATLLAFVDAVGLLD